jgi:hypothetical protein
MAGSAAVHSAAVSIHSPCQPATSTAGLIATYFPFLFNNLQFRENVVFRVSWGAKFQSVEDIGLQRRRSD